jgi:hypothetical protein
MGKNTRLFAYGGALMRIPLYDHIACRWTVSVASSDSWRTIVTISGNAHFGEWRSFHAMVRLPRPPIAAFVLVQVARTSRAMTVERTSARENEN